MTPSTYWPLRELDATFLSVEGGDEDEGTLSYHAIGLERVQVRHSQRIQGGKVVNVVESTRVARGISFLCPGCLEEHRLAPAHRVMPGQQPRSVHRVMCWFPGAPAHASPAGRQEASGESVDDLSLVGEISADCGWRGVVVGGQVESR
jgi:hypothetical protein